MRFASLLVVAAAFALNGCGLIYFPQKVYEPEGVFGEDDTAYQVEIVNLNSVSVREANQAPYVPPSLPVDFDPIAAEPTEDLKEAVSAAFDRRELQTDSIDDLNDARNTLRSEFGVGTSVFVPQEPRPNLPVRRPATILPPSLEPTPYAIGIGDVLLLSTETADADLNALPTLLSAQANRRGYVVQDDGAISIPGIGRVYVGGTTLEEATDRVFNALVSNNINPTFTLEIAEFLSQSVAVGGLVGQPGVLPITLKPLYLRDALAVSGGIRASDAKNVVVRLLRDGELYQIPADRLTTGTTIPDILLTNNDVIYVDVTADEAAARRYFAEQLQRQQLEREDLRLALELRQTQLQALNDDIALRQQQLNFQNSDIQNQINIRQDNRTSFNAQLNLGSVRQPRVYMAGEVNLQGAYSLPFDQTATLADAIYSRDVRGFNPVTGDPSEIYVFRRTGPLGGLELTAYRLDAQNALNLPVAAEMQLRPNDVIFVQSQPVTDFARVISQLVPNIASVLSLGTAPLRTINQLNN